MGVAAPIKALRHGSRACPVLLGAHDRKGSAALQPRSKRRTAATKLPSLLVVYDS